MLAEDLIADCEAKKDAPIRDDSKSTRIHVFEKLFPREKVCVECRAKIPNGRVGTSKFGYAQCGVAVHTQCFPDHIYRADGTYRD